MYNKNKKKNICKREQKNIKMDLFKRGISRVIFYFIHRYAFIKVLIAASMFYLTLR